MLLASIFATPEKDEWGGITYVPTTLGTVCIVALIIIALGIAAFLIGKKETKISTKQLVVSAACMALAFVTSMIKLFEMPMGGSVTLLSMLFITLVGYWYGIGAGVLTGVAYGLLQLVVDPYILTIPQMLVDYPLAFGALGLSGVGKYVEGSLQAGPIKIGGLQLGYIVGVLGRYFFAFLSGWIFFGEYATDGMSAPVYSLAYNGAYLAAEGIITLIVLTIPPVTNALIQAKKMVAE